MKPLKLFMQAFGAYIKPTTLDFEKNLRGQKIFLIHGATGAGKTTILDAICFALYGTASGDERDAAMMRSKGVDDKTLTEVEFTFALGEKIYTVRRELSYHPNRKTNQTQINAELICGGQVIETQATRVTNAIKNLLGFAPQQFRQVVMLPQGAFKNFLAAKSEERQPVLDMLFNAAFYGRVEEGLKLKADAAQKIFDDLNRDRNNLTAQLQGATFDAAALDKLRADYSAAQENSADRKKLRDKAQGDYTAGKILAGDFDELARRDKALVTAKNNLADAEKIFDAAKTEYDLRDGEQSQRDKLKADVDALTKIKQTLAELDTKSESRAEAEKNFQTANGALQALEADADKFDKRLRNLKNRRDELSGAEKILSDAQILLQNVEERDKILQRIYNLNRELDMTLKKISAAERNYDAAQIELERLQKLGSVAVLAKNLVDGEPCPVCGSRTHYPVDFSDVVPTDAEIAAAKVAVDRCKKSLDTVKTSAASIEGQLLTQRDNLKKYDGLPTADEAQKNLAAAKKNADELADCNGRINLGEDYIAKNKRALDTARKNRDAASNAQARLLGEVQTLQSQIPQEYFGQLQKILDDIAALQKTLRDLETAWKAADKKFREASDKKSSCTATVDVAQKNFNELADKLKNKTPPDIDALKIRADDAQKNYDDAIREETSLKNNLDNLTNISAQLVELDKKISVAEKILRVWRKLSDAACGKIKGNKFSFARYYLSAMFEQVLTEANYRLAKMSDRRYSLQSQHAGKRANSTAGLNLEIFDDYTGTTRPVETLSGGESFLASLSLALGLAAVVRNNAGGIKLDTIFIDEGFGTLDSETLDFALKTLIELHSGGRLVGIISHVEELKKQIPVRLEVTKTKTGSTANFRYGSSRD